jgi:hypothetical protein
MMAARGLDSGKRLSPRQLRPKKSESLVSSGVYVGHVLPSVLMGDKKTIQAESVLKTLSGTLLKVRHLMPLT